ncbi:15164_t:CDS:2, partial [Racocetra persica]
DEKQIIYYHKDCYNIYEMFHTRYFLHKIVYKHNIGRAIDHMICDALEEANQYYKFKNAIRDPEKYMRLSDSIFYEIEYLDKIKNAIRDKIKNAIRNTENLERLDPDCSISDVATYLMKCIFNDIRNPENSKRLDSNSSMADVIDLLIGFLIPSNSQVLNDSQETSDRQIMDDSQEVPSNSQVLDDSQETSDRQIMDDSQEVPSNSQVLDDSQETSDRQIMDDSQEVLSNSQVLDDSQILVDNQEAPSNDDKLKKSRDILDRIRRRDLYKFVIEYKIPLDQELETNNIEKDKIEKDETEKTIQKYLERYRNGITNEKIADKNPGRLNKDYIIVDWLTLDYGKGRDNPVDNVTFYDKNYKEKSFKRSEVSDLLPKVYCEEIVRIYTRKNDKQMIERIEYAFREVLKELKSTEMMDTGE